MHVLHEYLDEEDTPYSGDSDFCPEWLFQYFNEIPLDEDIESSYLVWSQNNTY